MKTVCQVLVLTVLAHYACVSVMCVRPALGNPFPLGTIGCLASDVCGPSEVCLDDLLFGTCQDALGQMLSGNREDIRGVSRFYLEPQQIQQLQNKIWSLIQHGFTWQDAYTQCTLQNILVAFQRGLRFNPRRCEDALGVSLPGSRSWAGDAKTEIASLLSEMLQDKTPGTSSYRDAYSRLRSMLSSTGSKEEDAMNYVPERLRKMYQMMYQVEDPYSEDGAFTNERYDVGDVFDPRKRDEFVNVHKYFDQSKGQLKRNSFIRRGLDPYNILAPLPSEELRIQTNDGGPGYVGEDNTFPCFAETVPVSMGETKEREEVDDLPFLVEGPANGDLEASLGEDEIPGVSQNEDVNSEDEDESISSSLSPRDEALLEQLLEGSVEPGQVPVDQQKRLSRFIETMISMLEMKGSALRDHVDVVNEDDTSAQPEETADSNFDIDQDDNEKDDDNDDSATDEKSDAVDEQGNDNNVDDNDGENMEMDKKASEATGDSDSTNNLDNTAVVKTKYTFLKLDTKVDKQQAEKFVHNLTSELHVPSGVAKLDQVNGDQLILKVAQDPLWNSSTLARQAEAHSDALYQDTGLRVVEAGIGKGVTVDVKEKNGRHIVVTFVLVGSVAGVVLAVSVIYLIQRHRHSHHKMAALASSASGAGDGEEASKDYQDLCRQRMQSKASEKPEPIHVVSRVGSVSETQVRSPSSRSSTSSWSEEPVASNMDISTGHVVLAYMEDHLKNGDRLGQEWEALSAYQADPSNTTVATDPSNTRKNRYTDVLPYDHSRVVLSAATNVTNSDYANASFITDHDPRNPAYICTQGPLPHTVADFWQMVWEQGSVVIVMLTKLTENGTAMCHRYWPEEGSDLYHIYEVHLVSEHIWCDDYLVRSFYLKNLQTNETRTVTQFHFQTWLHLNVPPSMKALLDFRRKVNKSFRGGSSPIVLHCNDGCGRSGTYCLVDMVLNRMAKGAKEIDMAATLEHIRDQRMNMVQTKEQFQFALSAVAEEVHAILKALPQ